MHSLLASVVQFCKMFGESSAHSYSPRPFSCRDLAESPETYARPLISYWIYGAQNDPRPTWFLADSQGVVSSHPNRFWEDHIIWKRGGASVYRAKALLTEIWAKWEQGEQNGKAHRSMVLAKTGMPRGDHPHKDLWIVFLLIVLFTEQKTLFALWSQALLNGSMQVNFTEWSEFHKLCIEQGAKLN